MCLYRAAQAFSKIAIVFGDQRSLRHTTTFGKLVALFSVANFSNFAENWTIKFLKLKKSWYFQWIFQNYGFIVGNTGPPQPWIACTHFAIILTAIIHLGTFSKPDASPMNHVFIRVSYLISVAKNQLLYALTSDYH